MNKEVEKSNSDNKIEKNKIKKKVVTQKKRRLKKI